VQVSTTRALTWFNQSTNESKCSLGQLTISQRYLLLVCKLEKPYFKARFEMQSAVAVPYKSYLLLLVKLA